MVDRVAKETVSRFAMVGVATAVLYYSLLAILVEAFEVSAPVASSLVYPVIVAFNYLARLKWTYRSSSSHATALRRYVLMILGGFVLNGLIMHLGVAEMKFNYLLMQAVAMGVVILWNFILSTLWVFQ